MNPYSITTVTTGLYLITEHYAPPATCTMQCVVGTRKAALIDTGTGVGDLMGALRQVTDLPICVLHTHGHMDHMGADDQFQEIYLSSADDAFLNEGRPAKGRLEYVTTMAGNDAARIAGARTYLHDLAPILYRDLHHGDRFDLGGAALTAFSIRGHTLGSMAFIDEARALAYCGDSLLPRIWLHTDARTSVAQYRADLTAFLNATTNITAYYGSHRDAPMTKADIHNVLACCDEILAGAPGEDFSMLGKAGKIHSKAGIQLIFNPLV